VITAGTGATPKKGDTAPYYTGTLEDGTKVRYSRDSSGSAFSFKPSWSRGSRVGMKVYQICVLEIAALFDYSPDPVMCPWSRRSYSRYYTFDVELLRIS
jgi:hypothetical protein